MFVTASFKHLHTKTRSEDLNIILMLRSCGWVHVLFVLSVSVPQSPKQAYLEGSFPTSDQPEHRSAKKAA